MSKADIFKYLSVLGILLAIVGVSGYQMYGNKAEVPVRSTEKVAAEAVRAIDTVQFVAVPGVNVLDQLKSAERVETKQTEYGTLVESINGVVNGTDGKYWLFYVDGMMADSGADAYITKGGEVIEWKFEK